MKTKNYLLSIALLLSATIYAQDPVLLLPVGVKVNINNTRKATQNKNLIVSGEKTKGYKAFFAASDAEHGEELWMTDGMPDGTKMVKDINPGEAGSDINWIARFNDKVVFAATDGTNGMELWISDGTEAGTYMVADIHEVASSEPRGFTQLNETQFVFGAKTIESENYTEKGPQWWLWISDGTKEGTKLIYECDTKFPGQDNTSWHSPYCRVGRKVFFKADNKDGTVGEELWVTDGTPEGTLLIKDINTESIATGTANAAIDGMINFYNEKLFFKAFSIEHGNEPWVSDGTPEGTYEIIDSNPTKNEQGFPRSGGASDAGLFPYKGKVYFRGFSLEAGHELACVNLDVKNDFTIFDINKNEPTSSSHSHADPGVEFDGVYMFCAATGFDGTKPDNFGGELHYTDGNTVTMQSDLGPGTQCNWVKELTVVAGSLYWWNESGEDPEKKQKIFRIDNKSQFPVRVTNLKDNGDQVHTLRNLAGTLLFATADDNFLYAYTYRKEGYDPAKDTEDLDIEFRTRAEIAAGIPINRAANHILSIYPNPTIDRFDFDITGRVLNVKIYDVTGALVKQITKPVSRSVDVSTLPGGVYQVLIDTPEKNYAARLIIQ